MQTLTPLSTAAEFAAVAASLTESQCRTLWAIAARSELGQPTASKPHAASVRALEKLGLLWNGALAMEGRRVFWLLCDGEIENPNWG